MSNLRDELQAAVTTVLLAHGEMATKWVMVVESIGTEDGQRGLWVALNEDMATWDTLGMLAWCQHKVTQAIGTTPISSESDGE